jgi:hypothetical protein
MSDYTYNSRCLHFDSYLGVCGHRNGELKACRERICPINLGKDE